MVFPALREEPTVTVKLFSAGIAACVADVITFPLDVAKVRLQIQGEVLLHQSCNKTVHKGMFAMLTHIASHEGPKSLYNGLCAGLQRQMCFASIRIGLYDSVKNYYNSVLGSSGAVESNVGIRILAGVTTGGLSVVFAQPTDVVKVRMQAQVSGTSQRYAGTISAYKTISVEEGIKGLWKGTLPNIARNAIVNAAELVCYDCIKDLILRKGYMSDNVPCHFSSAFAAGFCATVVASPVDVVKTRFMNSRTGQYSGALDCACKMFREGGISAFYKGFFPSFIRLGSWNICMFVTYEQLKRLLSSEKPRTVPAYDWANMYALATYVRCSSLHKSRFYPKAINQWE